MTELAQPDSAQFTRSRKLLLISIICVFAAALLLTAAWQAWLHPDESYYIIGAAQMNETGNYLVPHTVLGDVRVNKPPLTYHFVVAGFALLGDSFLAARLFFVVSAAMVVGLTYALALAVGARGIGPAIASAALAGNFMFFKSGYTAIPDMPATLGLTAALLGFARMFGTANRPRWASYAAYGGLAFAVLAKGLLAVPLLLLAVGLRVWRSRGNGGSIDRNEALAIVLSALIGSSWYVWILLQAPDAFLAQFLGDQVTEKVGFGARLLFRGLATNALNLVFGFLPFLLMTATRRLSWPRLTVPSAPVLLLVAWLVLVVALFSFSGFLTERYMVPAMPALAALIGLTAGNLSPLNLQFRLLWSVRILSVLPLLAAALSIAILRSSGSVISGLILTLITICAFLLVWRIRKPGIQLVVLASMQALVLFAAYPGYRVIALPEVWEVAVNEIASAGLVASDAAVAGTGKDNDARRLFVQLGLLRGPMLDYGFENGADPVKVATATEKLVPNVRLIVTLSAPLAKEFGRRGYTVTRRVGSLQKVSFAALAQAIRTRDFDRLRRRGGKPIFLIRAAGL